MSHATLAAVPELSDPLTWKQICERYPDEWVALVEIDWINDRDFDFRSARVAGHGKRRKEPMVQAEPFWARYHTIGHFYTGRIAELGQLGGAIANLLYQGIEIDHVARVGARDVRHEPLVLPSEGLDRYFGQWPGDEDDEQVFAALRELS